MLFKKILEKDYNIFSTGDFTYAMEVMKNNQINLMIIDINLSGSLISVELLQSIIALPGYKNIPTIAVTAYVGNYSNSYCLEQGFDYYIEKPFDIRRFR